ncbi:MAG: hypothetical protein ACREM1_24120, partial [Longimicrobiales bacterium]
GGVEPPTSRLSGHRRDSVRFDLLGIARLSGTGASADFGRIRWVLSPVLAPGNLPASSSEI